MEMREQRENWSQLYRSIIKTSPSEYVIRMFKGKYPNLELIKDSYVGKKICDIGFGDGANLSFLETLGFDIYGVEISSNIVNQIANDFKKIGIKEIENRLKVGENRKVPFDDNYFDYLLSWNSCYYMGDYFDFETHVKEFARILKPGGKLIFSIPKETCFIYRESEKCKGKYRIIKNDPFKVRNGIHMRCFENKEEIESEFSCCFKDFVFGSIQDDCFGYDYHWHIGVCTKK